MDALLKWCEQEISSKLLVATLFSQEMLMIFHPEFKNHLQAKGNVNIRMSSSLISKKKLYLFECVDLGSN